MKLKRCLALPLLLLTFLLCTVPAQAAGGAPQIVLKPTGAAREYQVVLENWDSSASSVQFDIALDKAVESGCKIEWADSSSTSYYKMEQKDGGDAAVLTFYCDKRAPISGADSAVIGALTLPETAEGAAFTTSGNMKLLDASSLSERVYSDASLRVAVSTPSTTDGSDSRGSSRGSSQDSAPRYGWADVSGKLQTVNGVKTLELDMSMDSRLSADLLEGLKEAKAKAVLSFGDYTWVIDGVTVGTIPANRAYYDLAVEKTSLKNLTAAAGGAEILQFETAYDGALPFTAVLRWPLGAGYAGKTVWLGRYNSGSGTLSYQSKADADKDGLVELSFDHFSNYLLASSDLWGVPANPETGGAAPADLLVPTIAEVEQADLAETAKLSAGLSETDATVTVPGPIQQQQSSTPGLQPADPSVNPAVVLAIAAAVVLVAGIVISVVLARSKRQHPAVHNK